MEDNQKRFLKEIESVFTWSNVPFESSYSKDFVKDLNNGTYEKPSEYVNDKLSWLFDSYIPVRFKDELMYAVDASNKWVYSYSYYRRSFRKQEYSLSVMLKVIKDFHERMIIDADLTDIFTLNLSQSVKEDFLKNSMDKGYASFAIAYELDRGNKELEDCIIDILNGDSEIPVSRNIILGIIQSENERIHEQLGKLLLAARLQEGLRQVICECADMGTTKAFIHLIKVINENKLIRFSSVKRAVGTWLGLINTETDKVERISDKSLDLIIYCLGNDAHIEEYLKSEDSMKIYVALWAIAVFDVNKAIEKVKELSKLGTHHQILTSGYFCINLDDYMLSHDLSKGVLINHKDEYDILAIYMNYFIGDWRQCARNDYQKLTLEKYFKDKDEAEKNYKFLMDLYNNIPKKSIDFSPIVFPWYSASLTRTSIIARLCLIAKMLKSNEKIDEACELISECDTDIRHVVLGYTLYEPKTKIQKRVATEMLCDKESWTRDAAKDIVKKMDIDDDNYLEMESMLKYKNANIRSTVISFLLKQDDNKLLETVIRLLSDKKEEKRTAGLDLIMNFNNEELVRKAAPYVKKIEDPSANESILIDNILKNDNEEEQLYTEKDRYIPVIEKTEFIKKCTKEYKNCFPIMSAKQAAKDCDSLNDLFMAHIEDEFKGFCGEIYTLGVKIQCFTEEISESKFEVPLLNLWKKWYEDNINDSKRLIRIYLLLSAPTEDNQYNNSVKPFVVKLFGRGYDKALKYEYKTHILKIINRLVKEYVKEDEWTSLAVALSYWYLTKVPDDKVLIDSPSTKDKENKYLQCHLIAHEQLAEIFSYLSCSRNQYFNEIFPLQVSVFIKTFKREVEISEKYKPYSRSESRYSLKDNSTYNCAFFRSSFYGPGILSYIIACFNKIISKEAMYEYLFREENIGSTLSSISLIASGYREGEKQAIKRERYNSWSSKRSASEISNLLGDVEDEKENEKLLKFADNIYEVVINHVLTKELKRGDSETEYSKKIKDINRIYGLENFVSILTALGKDKLERSIYYKNESKKGCLSHLLSVCIPNKEDNEEELRKLLKGTEITDERLIEAALYSPEWLDIVEKYLGWQGFRSGCYYFMAHMNERFDDARKAMIAKYTPLSEEELNLGAFDINWFREAYNTLGKKRFDMIYKSAKYISDGSKHSRARKYADATLGKIDKYEAEEKISDKRNKDLLMAYSLIPLKGEDDISSRYLFLQNFLKESKQFGAQRIASEKAAVEISLQNLATNAGYSDVTRLTLRMETKLINDIKDLFNEKEIDDITVNLHVDEEGKAYINCFKKGKALKSIPAKYKKNEYIVTLKDTKKKLTEQYRRTRLMFEESMEDEIEFTAEEIDILKDNPVVYPIIKDLLFMHNEDIGFIVDKQLVNYDGIVKPLKKTDNVKVAHPFNIYKNGHWSEYQKLLFDKQIKQSFKQVFRELYVKTSEELEMDYSRRYSGNQIQVMKTVACLKKRRWVADVEDGLQKIYYKENIVARIYAMADWFTPADIEAPTLEYVEFTNRKDGSRIKISEIPDIIFSEVMRDVDLAVSACHAGGVDPETSHSTVEMRAALIKYTLPLFKLDNVKLNKNHAIVTGYYGTYTINLGSGVIHKQGSAMVSVIPVHSQHRGKIFLPFADDDPKTSEIISKVIMFAEDKKIKDPSILEQILGDRS